MEKIMRTEVFGRDDQVAVLPSYGAPANEVLGIETITFAGPAFVQLRDGRMYATIGGVGLKPPGCIALATDQHRAVMQRRFALRKQSKAARE
jgi:hypothetical protein